MIKITCQDTIKLIAFSHSEALINMPFPTENQVFERNGPEPRLPLESFIIFALVETFLTGENFVTQGIFVRIPKALTITPRHLRCLICANDR